MCICYANITFYVESDLTLMQIIHTYRMSILDEKSYQYGVEVPKKRQQALDLDSTNSDKLWEKSMDIEINQIFHELKSFKVFDDDQPLPAGYWKSLYHLTFDLKVDRQHKS